MPRKLLNAPMRWGWRGYYTKAESVLQWMESAPAGVFERDGEWYRLGRANNVGAKLLVWMVEHGQLERRYGGAGRRYEDGATMGAMLDDWYRPGPYANADDLGDLWLD